MHFLGKREYKESVDIREARLQSQFADTAMTEDKTRALLADTIQITDQILGKNQSAPQKDNGILRMEYLRSDIEEQLSYYKSQKTQFLGLRASDNIFITKLKEFLSNHVAVTFTIDNGLLIFINILLENRLLLQPETPSSNVYKNLLEKSKTLKIIINLKEIDVLTHDLLCKICAHPDLPYERYYNILFKNGLFTKYNWLLLTEKVIPSPSSLNHYSIMRISHSIDSLEQGPARMQILNVYGASYLANIDRVFPNQILKIKILEPEELPQVLWLMERFSEAKALTQQVFYCIIRHAVLFLSESVKNKVLTYETKESLCSFLESTLETYMKVLSNYEDKLRNQYEYFANLASSSTVGHTLSNAAVTIIRDMELQKKDPPRKGCIIC